VGTNLVLVEYNRINSGEYLCIVQAPSSGKYSPEFYFYVIIQERIRAPEGVYFQMRREYEIDWCRVLQIHAGSAQEGAKDGYLFGV